MQWSLCSWFVPFYMLEYFPFPHWYISRKSFALSHSYHCWCVDKEDVKLFIILANVISLIFYLGHRAKEEPSRMIWLSPGNLGWEVGGASLRAVRPHIPEGPVGAAIYTEEHTSGAKWRVLGWCRGPREPDGSSAGSFTALKNLDLQPFSDREQWSRTLSRGSIWTHRF